MMSVVISALWVGLNTLTDIPITSHPHDYWLMLLFHHYNIWVAHQVSSLFNFEFKLICMQNLPLMLHTNKKESDKSDSPLMWGEEMQRWLQTKVKIANNWLHVIFCRSTQFPAIIIVGRIIIIIIIVHMTQDDLPFTHLFTFLFVSVGSPSFLLPSPQTSFTSPAIK